MERAADREGRKDTQQHIGDTGWYRGLVHDLRHALRVVRRNPAFALMVVGTLALGIGVNTAIFSIVHGVLLRPLPYGDGERVVWIWSVDPREGLKRRVSYPDFED